LHNYIRIFYSVIFSLALLWAGFAVCTFPALARDAEEASPFDNLAVALVIDVSGSMSYTDPDRLRESSAGMFIDLLGADDYLSVITFDHEAELIKPLEPVGSPADKAALMERLSPRLDPRGDTDFIEALQLARRQFAQTDIGDKVPVIMLLTDGEPDPYPGALADEEFMAGYMEQLWEEVGLLADEGILIYNVAFSEEIDPEVIRRISTETRGLYFIMEDPGDLLVAFYRALEALKDRRSMIDETVDLGAGDRHSFSFEVAEYTRQLNLVLAGEAVTDEEEGLEVTVKPPQGTAEEIDELLIGGRESYRILIISRPQEEHYGTWEVEVAGRGEVIALGNADLYLEAVLIDPDPGASHPLGEPMEIQVEVITREKYRDVVFGLDLEVTAPGEDRAVSVPLEREGSSFRGVFEDVDMVGEYLFEWELTREGEVFYSSSAMVNVQQLPAIHTDFYFDEEGFRLGEEMVVSASLNAGGRRLQESRTLQVDKFQMNLEYRDGARVEMEMFDDGDRAHGNSRAGDGIWSNRLLFDREGAARAVLTVEGMYRDSDFVINRTYSFTVSEPGTVKVRLPEDDPWTRAGDSLEIPLQFISESPFTQLVRISAPDQDLELLRDRASVPPGETVNVVVEALAEEKFEPGSVYVTLEFAADDGMTAVEPEILDAGILVLTWSEAFRVQYSDLVIGLALGGGALILVGIFTVGGGSFLNRFYLEPRLKVRGSLYFDGKSDNPGHGSAREQQVDLGQARKKEVVLSFDRENGAADFTISSTDYNHDIIINNRWKDHLPGFIRGWKALFRRKLEAETAITCTPPGVLVIAGRVYTSAELHHQDQFETGDLNFLYLADQDAAAEGGRGVNILDGKM